MDSGGKRSRATARFGPLVTAMLALGCAGSSSTPSGEMEGLGREVHRHPFGAALFLAPELDVAEATITTPDGGTTTLGIGAELRRALVEATSAAFTGLTLIDEETYDGSLDEPHPAPNLWPESRERSTPPPRLVVACSPIDLEGRVIAGEGHAARSDSLSFRIELHFEVRTLDGVAVTAGRVGGRGVDRAGHEGETSVPERFERAVHAAVTDLSAQYALAIAGSELSVPADEEEPYAERPTDAEAM